MSTRMTPSDAANITRHLLALVEAEPSEEAQGVVKRVTDHLREYIKTATAGVIDDGGPVHPGTEANGLNSGWSGLSLRDHFAGLAMQGLLARGLHYQTEGVNSPRKGLDEDDIAGHSFGMADAMLRAREKPAA